MANTNKTSVNTLDAIIDNCHESNDVLVPLGIDFGNIFHMQSPLRQQGASGISLMDHSHIRSPLPLIHNLSDIISMVLFPLERRSLLDIIPDNKTQQTNQLINVCLFYHFYVYQRRDAWAF